MTTNPTLTTASRALFIRLAKQAGDWSGTPLIDVTPVERGNLTDLKRRGLLETFDSDGCAFAHFTRAGIDLAVAQGVDLTWLIGDPYAGPELLEVSR